MAGRLRRIGRILGVQRVEDTAACARALTAMAGRSHSLELVRGGAGTVTRAALTARVLASKELVPWPASIMRQIDPADPAFLPPLGLHPVLAARDRTWLGHAGRDPAFWVDPLGWCGFGEGPSVAVWYATGRRAWCPGRTPGESGSSAVVHQWRDEGGLSVITRVVHGDLELELRHWPIVLDGKVACAVLARLKLEGVAPRPVRLAFAIRPAGTEGACPIFDLSRSAEGLWAANGLPLMALARPGDECFLSRAGERDSWHRFAGWRHARAPVVSRSTTAGEAELHCPLGQLSGAEVFRANLSPGESIRQLVVVGPPPGAPALLVRTGASRLLSGAQADRRGVLRAGCEIALVEHQALLEACRQRLFLEVGADGFAGFVSCVALARLGFQRRAEHRLERALSRVRRDGSLEDGDVEDAAVLGWALAEYVQWTGRTAWARAQLPVWQSLLDRWAEVDPEPGGRGIFGEEGSARWTACWQAAALLGGSAALRDLTEDHTRWAMAGAHRKEDLVGLLGPAPWSASPDRAPDGAAGVLLLSCWLGLVSATEGPGLETARYLDAYHRHGGGLLLQGGAHPAATVLLEATLERTDPDRDALGAVAALASDTGAFPVARHPHRGALGEGDDLLGAALFVLLALERVQVDRGRIRVLPGILRARNLPTPYGPVDLEDGTLTGRWRGSPPKVEVVRGVTEP
ncbi:MAG: hypothetical protein QGG40_05940 [Myxococcota bacterium]|nr:hypothetical protein [Myxococcota bacterium]